MQPLGWLAVRSDEERTAAWLLRAMIAENVLERREGADLCLPVILPRAGAARTPKVAEIFSRVRRLWAVHGAASWPH